MHLLAAVAEADHLGLVRDDDKILIPLTSKELDLALKSEQMSWDYGKKAYEALIAGGEIEKWQEYSVRTWAESEGMPLPGAVEDES
jgi:hypothetical protein